MARFGSGQSGAPGKPTLVKRAAPVKKIAAPKAPPRFEGGPAPSGPPIRPATPKQIRRATSQAALAVTRHGRSPEGGPAPSGPPARPAPTGFQMDHKGQITYKGKFYKSPQDFISHGPDESIKHTVAQAWNRIYGPGGGDASTGNASASLISPPGASLPSKIVLDNASELVHNPKGVVKGLANQVTGMVGAAGDVGLPVLDAGKDLVTLHPGRAVKDLGKSVQSAERIGTGLVKDYKYRYGPLLAGNEKLYKQRIHQEPAAGITDIALAATGGGKLLRPITRGAIKSIPGGKAFLEEPRPNLRISGGKSVPQELSHKPTRVLLQRVQDKARVVANEKLPSRKPDKNLGLKPALQPQVANDITAGLGAKGFAGKAPRKEVVPISRRLTAKAQRTSVARTSAKLNVRFKHEKAVEVAKGADRAVGGLDRKLRPAEYHVLQGLVPIHEGATVSDVVAALKEHRAQLVANRSPKAIPLLRPRTELATVDHLIKHADQIFTPEGLAALRGFHAGELARAKRITEGTSAVRPATMEARARRPQGERLGIPYEPPAQTAAADTRAARDAYNQEYAARVKAAAAAKGLPEPVYFQHQALPLTKRSSETAGNVAKAVAPSHQSKMALFKTGRAVVTHQAYRQGLLDTIKAKHQVAAVADVAREHAFQWSLGKHGTGDTVHNLLTEIHRRGLRPEDVTFINFGVVHKAADGLDLAQTAAPADAAAALKAGLLDGKDAVAQQEAGTLVRTRGYVAVPKAAGDEILAATRPAGKTNRVLGRLQGLQSAGILGLNPSWEPMQIAANFLQSFAGMHGNVPAMLKNNLEYRKLDPAHQRIIDESLGISASEGMTSQAHLGYHQGPIAKAFEAVGQVPLVRFKGRAVRVTDVNPVHVVFGVDNLNNTFFRRAVFINDLKRQQAHDLVESVGHAQAALKQVTDLLHGNQLDQLRNVLSDPRKVETAARYTDRVLGDYLNYTSRERKYAKVGIMFYGFMRYATKTLFYTLPVHHPLAGAIALKLGQLHNEDIAKIFGTHDLPPWIYSRSYEFDANGKPVLDKNGNPQYRDLARINPVTSVATDVITQGPKALAGVVSPLFQGAADLVAGETVQTNLPLRLHGSAEKPKNVGLGDIVRVMGNRAASSTFPGRLLINAGGKTQGDDSLPFSQRPITYKTAASKAKDAQRVLARPSVMQQMFPLFEPRADTTKQYLSSHGHGPTAKIDAQISKLNTQVQQMQSRKPGTAGAADDGTGTQTPEYAHVRALLRSLHKQRDQILKTPPRKVLRPLPLTPEQKAQRAIGKAEGVMSNPGKATQAQIDKALRAMEGG